MHRLTAPALAVLALSLAACSSDGSSASPSPASTPGAAASTTAPAPSTSASPSASAGTAPRRPTSAASLSAEGVPVPGVSFTPTGARLGIGEKAVVAFFLNHSAGALGITVTSIDKGAEGDLASAGFGDRVKGLTPYYVQVTVTNETGGNFAGGSLGLTHPLLADDTEAQSVYLSGDFPACPHDFASTSFTTKGASFTTCVVGLATPSTAVTGLSYNDSTHGEVLGEPELDVHPIVFQSAGGQQG